VTDLQENLLASLSAELPESVETPASRSRWGRFFASKISSRVVIAGSLGILLLIVFVDSYTKPDVQFSLFYAVPVLLTSWFVGRTAGYILAGSTALACLAGDWIGAGPHTRVWVVIWNSTSRAAWLFLAAALLSALKNLSSHLGAMVEQRTKAVRRLAFQLTEAEDSERRRLALDIHDGFKQTLSLLKLNLAAALAENSEGKLSSNRINDAIGTVNELIQWTRTLTLDLHPAMLDHLGLVPTLRDFAAEFGRQSNIEILINQEGPPHSLSAVAANYLFRSVKELINNAARHGHARQIVVSVYWTPASLRILVDDDGGGFNAADALTPRATHGLGLPGIHERLLSLGGSLRMESSAGKGTRAVLEAPLPGKETDKEIA
jgi:signal transduction histidine kinase